jgi:hypothetical protein
MLLCAVSVLVVAQPSSEVKEGLMNYPVYNTDNAVIQYNPDNNIDNINKSPSNTTSVVYSMGVATCFGL